MARRSKHEPMLRQNFWIEKSRGQYIADREKLLAAIKESRRGESQFRSTMGVGYHLLDDVLNGLAVNGYQANHVEHGLTGPLREDLKV